VKKSMTLILVLPGLQINYFALILRTDRAQENK